MQKLDYYRPMVFGIEEVCCSLTEEQAAAVLKAHDYGVAALSGEELALIDQVMSILKESIRGR